MKKFRLLTLLLVISAMLLASCAPAQPAAPAETAAPAQPAATAQPAAPAETAAPAQPAAPAETAAPAQPAAPAETAAPAQASELVIAMDMTDFATLDPGKIFEVAGYLVDVNTYETLVSYTDNDWLTVKPLLAKSWKVSDDGLEYTFTLRDNAKFASGNPVTAEDVRWSYERLRNLKGNAAWYMDPVKETVVVDPQTVKLVLNDPNAAFLASLTSPVFSVLDSKVVSQNGGVAEVGADTADKAEEWLNQHSAGSGPYTLKDWVKNSEIIFEANPNYDLGTPKNSKVTIKHVKDGSTQRLMLESGDIDIAFNLSPDLIESMREKEGIKIVNGQTYDMVYVGMTNKPELNEYLANEDVRLALRAAVNYDELIALFKGQAIQPAANLPVGLLGMDDNWVNTNKPKQDLQKAKDLLAKAGYPNGFSLQMDVPTGNTPTGFSFEVIAQKLAEDFAKINVQLELVPNEYSVVMTKYRAKEATMNVVYTTPDYLDPFNYEIEWTGGHAARLFWEPADPAHMADLLKLGTTTLDPAKRAGIYQELTKLLIDEGPYITLLQPQVNVAIRDNVEGFIWSPLWWTNFNTISLK